jgi:hypothetical protein
MERSYEGSWGTESELNFINKVGTFGKETGMPRDRVKCLLGYATAFPLRVKWGGIKSDVVKEHLIATIKKEFDIDVTIGDTEWQKVAVMK